MKGTLVLTEGRSGSNWLISLTNETGLLGRGSEWLSDRHLQSKKISDRDQLIQIILSAASTSNNYFSVILFPAHVHGIQRRFGFDIVKYFRDNFDTNFVTLTRSDRIRQAISLVRATQTHRWAKHREKKQKEYYDFELISRYFFMIDASYQYWKSYTNLYSISTNEIIYEDMLTDPRPFVTCFADHCGISVGEIPPSKYSIQRDNTTEAWLDRFNREIQSNSIIPFSNPIRPYHVSPSNFRRLLLSEQLKPYPFTF